MDAPRAYRCAVLSHAACPIVRPTAAHRSLLVSNAPFCRCLERAADKHEDDFSKSCMKEVKRYQVGAEVAPNCTQGVQVGAGGCSWGRTGGREHSGHPSPWCSSVDAGWMHTVDVSKTVTRDFSCRMRESCADPDACF